MQSTKKNSVDLESLSGTIERITCGFSKEEAIVAYNEGAKLFIQAAQRPKTISLCQVKAAQEISKNEFTAHSNKTLDAANIANQSSQKFSTSITAKVSTEIAI
ncbi:MAG: hypothetical protein ACRY3E_00835 [Candidatus Lariskella arthropodorum]